MASIIFNVPPAAPPRSFKRTPNMHAVNCITCAPGATSTAVAEPSQGPMRQNLHLGHHVFGFLGRLVPTIPRSVQQSPLSRMPSDAERLFRARDL
ncbi:hypothetical protein VCV18_011715 [Metarhizium anisopliae]